MMTFRRSAGLAALLTVGAMLLVGCGGGDGGEGAQTGRITGVVQHAATQLGLGDVEVSVGNVSTRTASDGSFTLNNVPAGQRTVVVTAAAERGLVLPPGVDLTVTVQGGETTALSAPIQMIDAADVPPDPPS